MAQKVHQRMPVRCDISAMIATPGKLPLIEINARPDRERDVAHRSIETGTCG
jgi:hypothetical protein